MSEEAIPPAAALSPTTESLSTRPAMEEAEIKNAAGAKEPGHEGEDASEVATSEGNAPTSLDTYSGIAFSLSSSLLYSPANTCILAYSQGSQ